MWLCQRLFLTCLTGRSRSLMIREKNHTSVVVVRERNSGTGVDGPLMSDSGVRSVSRCRLRECAHGHKVIRLHFTTRGFGVKHNQESAEQSRTFVYLLKWGVLTILMTTVVSTAVVWWELWLLRQNLSTVTSTLTGNPALIDMPITYLMQQSNNTGNSHGSGYSGGNGVWLPWLQSKSQDPFTLLELCRSDNPAVRRLGVRALAAKTTWEDYQYRYVAQAADYRTLIGLSRSHGADPRFFLSQPLLVETETPALEELASVLLLLDLHVRNSTSDNSRTASDAAIALAQHHLHHKYRPTDDKNRFWGFDGSQLDVASVDTPLAEDKLLMHFLTALGQFCCIQEQALLFVKRKGLAVLQRIIKQYQDTEIFTAVAAVLGNLALYSELHEAIVQRGWLGILKSWTEGRNSKLAVMAGRVLANLDKDWTTDILDDGIVILHPLHRSRKTVHADVIFVHGLLGGAVKTWRQQDAAARSPQLDDDTENTDCWPKDWLAKDCPHIRIFSIHYDAALSLWSTKSVSGEKSTLEGRSKEILDKLRKAGVGTRPVIWVGHSMGGLLIKQMLQLLDMGQYSDMKQQTCGFLLYSVPHKGLSIATRTNQVHYILYPSTEVRELSSDSPHLHRLHEHFQQFVRTNSIPCLSFGEQYKTRFRKTLPKLLLVPPESSDPGVGEFLTLPLDHINICKPDSRDSVLYQKSLAFVHQAIFFSYLHRFKQAVSGTVD